MSWGAITPGTRVVVYPDAAPVIPASASAPTPTMTVIAQDVIDIWQAVLNVGACAVDGFNGGSYDPAGWVTFNGMLVGNGLGVTFINTARCLIGDGGVLAIGTSGTAASVTSDAAATWSGTYTHAATAVLVGATSGGDTTALSGTWLLSGTLNIDDTGALSGLIALLGTAYLSIGATASIHNLGNINNTYGGRVLYNYTADITTSLDYSTTPEDMPEIISMAPAADRTLTLPTTPYAGQRVSVTTINDGSGAFQVTINGTGISQVIRNATAFRPSVDLYWNGTTWRTVHLAALLP